MKFLLLFAAAAPLIMLVSAIDCGDATQNAFGNKPNGTEILSVGTNYDNAFLQLLQNATNDLDKEIKCALGGCGQWSDWASCPVTDIGQFGMRSRTRECYMDRMTCEMLARNTTEIDYELCEGRGVCPETYKLTTHGYCLKYVSSLVTKSGAKNSCKADGGYVVNVNSPVKLDDIVEMAKAGRMTNSGYIRIDGQRLADWRSPFIFSYQTDLTWSPKYMGC